MPLLISSFFDHEDNFIKGYQDANIPVFYSPENAARALSSLYSYKQIRERTPRKEVVLPKIKKSAADMIRQAQKKQTKRPWMSMQVKSCLPAYGIPVTKEALAINVKDALAAAEKIGYPVALKACSWEIMHKSGKGLIALNVEGEAQLKKEFKNIQKNAGWSVTVLVQEMLKGGKGIFWPG